MTSLMLCLSSDLDRVTGRLQRLDDDCNGFIGAFDDDDDDDAIDDTRVRIEYHGRWARELWRPPLPR